MNLKNKKILIVGGCGFIGHNLGVHLKSKGADVYLLDSLTINNMNSVLDNKDSLPNPEISMSFLNERMRIIKLKDIKLLGFYTSSIEYKQDTVFCYNSIIIDNSFHKNDAEISEAQWFRKDSLPENQSRALIEAILLSQR